MTEQRRGESPRCDRCRSPYPRRPRRHDYGTVLRNSTSRFHSSPTTSKPLHTGGGRDSDRRRQYGLRTFRGFPRRLSHHCPTARATGNRAPPVCASRETARARDRSYDSPRGRCPQLCACRALPLVCYRARNGSTLCLRSGVRSLRSETTRRSSRPSSGDSLQISGLLVSTAAGRSPSYMWPSAIGSSRRSSNAGGRRRAGPRSARSAASCPQPSARRSPYAEARARSPQGESSRPAGPACGRPPAPQGSGYGSGVEPPRNRPMPDLAHGPGRTFVYAPVPPGRGLRGHRLRVCQLSIGGTAAVRRFLFAADLTVPTTRPPPLRDHSPITRGGRVRSLLGPSVVRAPGPASTALRAPHGRSARAERRSGGRANPPQSSPS